MVKTLTFILRRVDARYNKKELVEILCALGLSVSYDRVLHLLSDLANAVCERYEENGTVCPPNLCRQVFTTAVVDNIDHNPSFTTATGSFHGTSISLNQHPSTTEKGHDMGQIVLRESSPKKFISCLTESYTNVPTAVLKSGKPTVNPVSESMMVRNQSTITDAINKEVESLEDINKIYTAGKTETETRNVNASIVGENTIKYQNKV